MSISRRSQTIALSFAAGTVPLLLALSLRGQTLPSAPVTPDAATPRQIADSLDAIMQPRFQDDRAGVFGTGRLVPTVRGHIAVNYFQPNTDLEKKLWSQAMGTHRPFLVSFLHCAHVPGKFKDAPASITYPSQTVRVPTALPNSAAVPWMVARPSMDRLIDQTFTPGPDWTNPNVRARVAAANQARQEILQQVATDALPALRHGQSQEKMMGDWLVVMRPVRASKDSCLTCHVGAKRGDTLGAMVYAVSNTVNKN